MDKSVKQIALGRAINMLKASGAKFAIITDEGETITHGDIEITKKVEKKRYVKTHRPVGALVKHYGPLLKPMQPGDVATVPLGGFELKELRAAISAWGVHAWGPKSCIVASKKDGVEVLRVI
jgi:hypothetical protein